MSARRKVEVFSAGCPACKETIELVNRVACPSCEVIVLDMQDTRIANQHILDLSFGSLAIDLRDSFELCRNVFRTCQDPPQVPTDQERNGHSSRCPPRSQ